MTYTEKIRLLVVDDHPLVLMGVKTLLSKQPDIDIVGEARSASEALELAGRLKPDVIILDISLPDALGLDVARQIKKTSPETRIIIHSMHDAPEYVEQFVRSGASAYVLKEGSPEEIVLALRNTIHNGAYFSPRIAETLLRYKQRAGTTDREHELTDREEQVLKLLARGKTSKEIADELCISTRTVAKHRENLMEKLDMHSVAELTQYAIAKKLIKENT